MVAIGASRGDAVDGGSVGEDGSSAEKNPLLEINMTCRVARPSGRHWHWPGMGTDLFLNPAPN